MEYVQKFIPEGWNTTEKSYEIMELQNAKSNGTIIQGFVYKCDDEFNLQVNLGKDIIGIIPRSEMDAINKDEFGMTRSSICKNKVNQFVQFKVKEIYDENRLLLSRKEVGEDALEWVKNDLEVGTIVNGIIKNIRQFGAFVDIGGGVTRIASYRKYFSI